MFTAGKKHLNQLDCDPACECYKGIFGVQQNFDEVQFLRSASSAAQKGDVEKLRRILDRNPDECDADTSSSDSSPDGYAPIHYASRSGALSCVKLLIERGAFVDRRTRAGQATALMRASYMGDLDMVLFLLESGADPLLQDSDGETALFKAASRGEKEVARALSRAAPGAIQMADRKGKTPADLMPDLVAS